MSAGWQSVHEKPPPDQTGQHGVRFGRDELRRAVGGQHAGHRRQQVTRPRRRVGHRDRAAPTGAVGGTAQLGDQLGQRGHDRARGQRSGAEPVPGRHHPLKRVPAVP